MKELEERILKTFIKYEGKEVKDLDLGVAFCEDNWPDDEGQYLVEVMERQDNGRVWTCTCSKNGTFKDTYEL